MTICNLSAIKSVDNVVECDGMPTEAALRSVVEKIGMYDKTHKHDLTIESYKNKILHNWSQ